MCLQNNLFVTIPPFLCQISKLKSFSYFYFFIFFLFYIHTASLFAFTNKKTVLNILYIQKPLHEHDDSPEEFRKVVEQKVIDRETQRKQKKDKLKTWSITTTILEENINCDVTTIKVVRIFYAWFAALWNIFYVCQKVSLP